MKWFKRKRLVLVIVFLSLIFVISQLITRSNWGQKPTIDTKQDRPLAVSVFLSYLQPTLSPNGLPINELDDFVSSMSAEKYNLFPNGELAPGTDDSSISLIFSEKPPQQKLEQIFILTTSIVYALPVTKGYLLEDNFYFASSNLPNVIIPLSLSAEKLSDTLQAIPSIAKIKEGIKTIDLRFNHPIIQ